ncbi:hypothetical protein HYALB_00007905 [Hymenoscyphus albidus]|uniref:Uncharacterized protein n=1 Tax=Hymenoscyphus albidus TaxID=595503 RepID=A0A9N9LNS0_9HELO|nr:hypothetical protein HYALB_00007905 [Hymenoscyphus albidus]
MPVFTVEELQAAVDNGTLGTFITDNNDTFQQGLRDLLSLYNQTTIDKNTAEQAQHIAEQAQQATEADALQDANEYNRQVTEFNNRIATLNTEIQRLQHLQATPTPTSNPQINDREEAFAKLQKEKQGHRPASEFLASYLSLATTANSTGFDCTQRLVLAIHPSIRDRILSDPRYTSAIELNALADLIREKDKINRAVHGTQYFKSNSGLFNATPHTLASTSSPSDPDVMDLDAIKVGGKMLRTRPGPRPLS